MEHAEKLCDSVFMICKGKKVLDGSLEEIRARWREEVLDVSGEGDVALLASAPGVESVRDHPGRFELLMRAGADPQEVLRHLAGRFRVTRFEVRVPKLHDLFVRIAGANGTATTSGGE